MTHTQLSRRRVLKGAAWSAPAIVLATAAPAIAASGPASVTTLAFASREGNVLDVVLTFVNQNTGSTGLTTVAVFFESTVPAEQIVPHNPTIDTDASTLPWTFTGTGGTSPERSFSFSLPAPGIPGAPTATGPGPAQTLAFSILVPVDLVVGVSFGTIRTLNVTSEVGSTIMSATTAWT